MHVCISFVPGTKIGAHTESRAKEEGSAADGKSGGGSAQQQHVQAQGKQHQKAGNGPRVASATTSLLLQSLSIWAAKQSSRMASRVADSSRWHHRAEHRRRRGQAYKEQEQSTGTNQQEAMAGAQGRARCAVSSQEGSVAQDVGCRHALTPLSSNVAGQVWEFLCLFFLGCAVWLNCLLCCLSSLRGWPQTDQGRRDITQQQQQQQQQQQASTYR
eukprot:1158829-Pelagomonas_calceolata.AAC.3